MTNIKNGVGTNIKILRKAKGITQEELSEIIGIHSRQLSKIETGDHFPSCRTLEKICLALDIEPRNLFDFEFCEGNIESVLTGTDSTPVFRLEHKASTKNSVYELRSDSKNVENTEKYWTDESMVQVAKSLNRPVFAEYCDKDKIPRLVMFYPDGRSKVVRDNETSEAKQDLVFMIKELKELSKDKSAMDFLKTAIAALSSNKELKKLDTLVDGMKLARKLK